MEYYLNIPCLIFAGVWFGSCSSVREKFTKRLFLKLIIWVIFCNTNERQFFCYLTVKYLVENPPDCSIRILGTCHEISNIFKHWVNPDRERNSLVILKTVNWKPRHLILQILIEKQVLMNSPGYVERIGESGFHMSRPPKYVNTQSRPLILSTTYQKHCYHDREKTPEISCEHLFYFILFID